MAENEEILEEINNEENNSGTIRIASDVVAIIAGMAASEVDGITGMSGNVSSGIADLLGRKNLTKGVKVEVGPQEVAVDLFTIVEYGQPIQKVASDVQENVRKALESLTGLHVLRVDVHVQGVSFEKENEAINAGKKIAAGSHGETAKLEEMRTENKPVEIVNDAEEAK